MTGILKCKKCGELGVYKVKDFGKAVLEGVKHEADNNGHDVTLS